MADGVRVSISFTCHSESRQYLLKNNLLQQNMWGGNKDTVRLNGQSNWWLIRHVLCSFAFTSYSVKPQGSPLFQGLEPIPADIRYRLDILAVHLSLYLATSCTHAKNYIVFPRTTAVLCVE